MNQSDHSSQEETETQSCWSREENKIMLDNT